MSAAVVFTTPLLDVAECSDDDRGSDVIDLELSTNFLLNGHFKKYIGDQDLNIYLTITTFKLSALNLITDSLSMILNRTAIFIKNNQNRF